MPLPTVDEVLHQVFPDGGYDIEAVPRDGLSGCRVVIVRRNGSNPVAVKYGRPTGAISTLRAQLQGRQLIEPFISVHLPEVLQYGQIPNDHGTEFMVMECPSESTLIEVVTASHLPDERCLALWQNILETFHDMWRRSKKAFDQPVGSDFPRNPRSRSGRIKSALQGYVLGGMPLSDLMDSELVVDGRRCGTLRALLDAGRALPPPTMAVTCHADPNPFNFLVNAELGEWSLVDWEWAHITCDWRLSISEFIGWWSGHASHQRVEPRSTVVDGTLTLEYQLRLPSVCIDMAKAAWKLAEAFAQETGDDRALEVVKWHVVARLVGDIRFLRARNRSPSFAVPLLGEAALVSTLGVPAWLDHYLRK